MPFQNVHPLCLRLEPLAKLVHNFLGQQKVTGLNHMYVAFGHLNANKYFKCSNNSGIKSGLLGIIPTEPTIIFRILESA